ncbi:MAG: hypothetical protein ABIS06_18075 [Vicinamibacterales bacterium]
MSELCADYHISRKTGDKSVGRHAVSGPRGLHDQSRLPHHSPRVARPALGRDQGVGGGGTPGSARSLAQSHHGGRSAQGQGLGRAGVGILGESRRRHASSLPSPTTRGRPTAQGNSGRATGRMASPDSARWRQSLCGACGRTKPWRIRCLRITTPRRRVDCPGRSAS